MEGKQAARGLMEVLLSRSEGERGASAPSFVSVYGIVSRLIRLQSALVYKYSAQNLIKEHLVPIRCHLSLLSFFLFHLFWICHSYALNVQSTEEAES